MARWRSLCFVSVLLVLSLRLCLAQDGDATYSSEAVDATRDLAEAGGEVCLSRSSVATSLHLARRFQDSAVLSEGDFRRLLTGLDAGLHDHGQVDFTKVCAGDAGSSGITDDGIPVNCSQILFECPSIEDVFSRHSVEGGLNYSALAAALQEAALALTNPSCLLPQGHHHGHKPTTAQTWGYGIGFIASICFISNIGGLLAPFMSKTFFQRLLQFLVAMGAGTLVATGLLVLLPEAFDIVSVEELSEDYVWKGSVTLLTIYVFFVLERILKITLKAKEQVEPSHDMSFEVPAPSDDCEKNMVVPSEANGEGEHDHSHIVKPEAGKKRGRGPVATVAWMVLIGDGTHKLVDGLAIGAAFTENVYLGISIGIAILCEELPHELGDVAILLHSGMSMKRALCTNLMSGSVSLLGLVIGIVLGETTEASRWILAVAGGLFIYVPLVDMLPDMSNLLELKMTEHKRSKHSKEGSVSREVKWILTCQCVGLLIGIGIILIVVAYSGDIEISNA